MLQERRSHQAARLAVVEVSRVVVATTVFTPLTGDIALAMPNPAVVRQVADALPGETVTAPASPLTCP